MTNKDSIQQKHENSVDIWTSIQSVEEIKNAATSCTTVTADAMERVITFLASEGYIFLAEEPANLVQLFLSQKAKI